MNTISPEGASAGRPIVRSPWARRVLATMFAVLLVCMAAQSSAQAAAIEDLPGCTLQTLAANDDGSTASVDLGFPLTFFGTSYSTAFVNNNGNVTFTNPLGDFVPDPIASVSFPIIAPFWADVDTTGATSPGATSRVVTYGTGTFDGHLTFCVNWVGVGYYSAHVDKLNSIQLLIVNRGDDIATGNADLYFNYDQVLWDLGDASSGVSARWGYANGSGAGFEGPGSAVSEALLDASPTGLIKTSTNSTVLGRHVFFIRNDAPETTIDAAPPAVTGVTQPAFSFSSNQDGAVFECRLDGQPFVPCSSPFSPADPLPDGPHVFEVVAMNAAGVRDATPATVGFAVDTTPPDTTIVSGPTGKTPSGTTTFTFSSDEAGTTFECSLDAGPFVPCSSPFTTTALAPGAHSFRVRAVDRAGHVDDSAATATFTVTAPDKDSDGVPDASDNCPSVKNSTQADRDRDRIGDACETLPPGNTPPVAGKLATVAAVSGKVYVKVPKGTKLPPLPPGQPTPPLPGYRLLDGLASVPVGSVVDARKGAMRLTTAATFKTGQTTTSQSAKLEAAIFMIKQAEARGKGKALAKAAATDVVLRTPPGKARACAARRSPKGAIRRLKGTVAKGIFRTVAGAGTITVRKGTWITQDRCKGTFTHVVRGRASVFDRRRHLTVLLKAGKDYRILALLFGARQAGRA